jgi:peptide/nickel transport system permease protein
MGLLAVNSASHEDVPTLLGVTFVVTVATIVGNLIADILYAVVDPRIRYAKS